MTVELTSGPEVGPAFQPWPKIARLMRECVITEKLDGTNAAIGVLEDGRVYAQSRNRLITPEDDNYGFARWVHANAPLLRDTLGIGLHFGEWWGAGIQRGYGLKEKRFSLFNTALWNDGNLSPLRDIGVRVVPTLYTGLFDTMVTDQKLIELRMNGSVAAPGFMNPEGIVIWHDAARVMFKRTIVGDEKPKGAKE